MTNSLESIQANERADAYVLGVAHGAFRLTLVEGGIDPDTVARLERAFLSRVAETLDQGFGDALRFKRTDTGS